MGACYNVSLSIVKHPLGEYQWEPALEEVREDVGADPQLGYEGLVAKDPASPYRGGRTLAWLKVKQPCYREGERGWEPKR